MSRKTESLRRLATDLSLKAAVAGVADMVGASLRQLAPGNAVQRDERTFETNKSNPIPHDAASPTGRVTAPFHTSAPTGSPRRQPAGTAHAIAVNASERQLTPVNTGQRPTAGCKTNPFTPVASPASCAALPPSAASELSPRQLAAARLIACGRKPADVAAELGLSRTGLWKWRRLPAFVAELRRLHETLAVATALRGGQGSR